MKDVALDRLVYVDGLDLTCAANQCDWTEEVDSLDSTTYCDGDTRTYIPGLRKSSVAFMGLFTEAAMPQRDLLGTTVVLTSTANPGTAGSPSFMASGLEAKWGLDSNIGQIIKTTATFDGQGALGVTQGKLILPSTVISAGASTAGVQIVGGVASLGHLVGTLHCFAVSGGPTVTAIIESGSSGAFSSPTTVATFVDVTASGAQKVSVAGPITDTWFRLTYTISAGSATIAAAVGASAT